MRDISQTEIADSKWCGISRTQLCISNSEEYQDTFHFDESMASFSFMLGCSCGCCLGCLGRWLFEAEFIRAFMERAMRLVLASALRTLTLTIWPALTASEGSLMYRLESSLIWTKPS